MTTRPSPSDSSTLYKAQAVVSSEPIPDLHLSAVEPIPDGGTLDDARDAYQAQAHTIATALRRSLPGGTIDALLVELLDLKRSLLVIPHHAPVPVTLLRSDVLRTEAALQIVGLARALETQLESIGADAGGLSVWTDPVWRPETVAAYEALQDALDTFDGKPARERQKESDPA